MGEPVEGRMMLTDAGPQGGVQPVVAFKEQRPEAVGRREAVQVPRVTEQSATSLDSAA